MNGARQQFFARAGFPQNEHGGLRGCHLRHVPQDRAERRRRPHDFLKHRRAVEVFAQRQVFAAHPLFGLLALVDVCARHIPAHETSLVIP